MEYVKQIRGHDITKAIKSEIAILRQEIEDAYYSAQQAVHGMSQVGRHKFITNRMERMGDSAAKLKLLAGEEVMMEVLMSLQGPEIEQM